ncbi:MAG TPA: helix-turn-helix domain-containing protein [bacterium]|nr:helix-turn-helix domain-containing protein [bacterium]HNT65168.1 helix-turn-helix domain-containing protein [bacterium]HOX86304.1 helix-turn-helix domain-containing protein [bacterium]HPG45867.1 helix-turn-helix domain-containing protein [bacterium]HPM97906.1 helix-turn-helix domain-containing protein [bacterium]
MAARSSVVLLLSSNKEWLLSCCSYLHERQVQAMPATNRKEGELLYHSVDRLDAVIADLRSDAQSHLQAVDALISNGSQPIIGLLPQADLGLAVELIKRGGTDYILAPFDVDEVFLTLLQVWRVDFYQQMVQARRNGWERERVVAVLPVVSPVMRERHQRLALLARTDSPLVFVGAPGSMKENYARIAHFLSPRRFQPFIEYDCETLQKNELTFLHQPFSRSSKQSPQDAPQRGTLFFRQVERLCPALQHQLIDYFDEQQRIQQNGAASGFRLLFSSCQSPDSAQLSEELLNRIGSSVVSFPALAERRDDLPGLTSYFMYRFARRFNKSISAMDPGALEKLLRYPWPGDVSELRSTIERAVILSSGDTLSAESVLVDPILNPNARSANELRLQNFALDDVEERLISHVLQDTGGNISRTAETLGISRGTLYNKLKKYHRLEHLAKRTADQEVEK